VSLYLNVLSIALLGLLLWLSWPEEVEGVGMRAGARGDVLNVSRSAMSIVHKSVIHLQRSNTLLLAAMMSEAAVRCRDATERASYAALLQNGFRKSA
jgi:hypothetical protein